jgi:hypothetical protein
MKQGYIKKTKPTRKELQILQRQKTEIPPSLRKQLQTRKRKAKRKKSLKAEVARALKEQKKYERGQRRDKPEGNIRILGEREDQAQAIAQAAAMGAAAAAALPPAAGVPPVVIGGGGGGPPPPPPGAGGVAVADIDRIRRAVAGDLRADIVAARAAAQQGLVAQAQQAGRIRQVQAEVVQGRREAADIRADVVEGRREIAAGRAAQEGGLDALRVAQQGQQQSIEGFRGELAAGQLEEGERRQVMAREQREALQIRDAQQAELVERLDSQGDDLQYGRAVIQHYTTAVEKAEEERLDREVEADRKRWEDITSLDKKTREFVDEVRAAQNEQGEGAERRLDEAELRLNSKIDALGQQIAGGEERRLDDAFEEAGRAARYPVEPVRRPARGGMMGMTKEEFIEKFGADQIPAGAEFDPPEGVPPKSRRSKKQSMLGLRAGEEIAPILPGSRSGSVVREPGVHVPAPTAPGSPSSPVTVPSDPTQRPGWEKQDSLFDFEPHPEPEPQPVQNPQALEDAFEGKPAKAKGVDRGKAVHADESELPSEDTKPKRQHKAERLSEGLEESRDIGPLMEQGDYEEGGSGLLEQEAEEAEEEEEEEERDAPPYTSREKSAEEKHKLRMG